MNDIYMMLLYYLTQGLKPMISFIVASSVTRGGESVLSE